MQSNTFLGAHQIFFHNFLILAETGDQEMQRKNNLGLSSKEQFLKQGIYNSSYFIVIVNHIWSYIPHALQAIYSIA